MNSLEPQGITHVEQLLRDRESRELLTQAELVADLQRHPGWALVKELLDETATFTERRLTDGHLIDSHPRTARALGYIRGCQELPTILEAFDKAARHKEAELKSKAETEALSRERGSE